MKTWEKILQEWAKQYLAGLDERVQDLIGMAHCDLWYGPYSVADYAEEDPDRKTQWPGFETACREIHDALDDIPSKVWLDTDCGEWTEHEPDQTEPCRDCDGSGCDYCKNGVIEAFLEFWVECDRQTLLRALVGKELANYI